VFEGWSDFYLVVGGAAGALIGLLFVVATLTQGYDPAKAQRGVAFYMTPTALGFAVVLTLSALALAPRLGRAETAIVFLVVVLAGLAGAVRAIFGILALARRGESPHWSDLWLYGVGPTAAYAGLVAAGIGLWRNAAWADEAAAALLMILLLGGIRNAWDLVTWMAPRKADPPA
jgi:hypothetical protein